MRNFKVGLCLVAYCLLIQGCKSVDGVQGSNQGSKPRCLPAWIGISENEIAVQNRSDTQWTRVRVSLNDDDGSKGFRANIPVLNPHKMSTIELSDFLRDDGLRFDLKTYAIDHVEFTSDQGTYNQIGCDKEFTRHWIERLSGASK